MSNQNEITFGKTVSIAEAEALITSVPTNRFHLRGEPGIGKSSMLERIGKKLGLPVAYIDVPNMDLGDIAMPVVDHNSRTTKYYPNSRFQLHTGQPVVIMLDEFSKGSKPVKDMLHPLLEVVNPRLGDVPVPTGSVIFSTGNLSSDGVGDNLAAHTKARLTTVTVRKPGSDEWIDWALQKGTIAEEIVRARSGFSSDALIAALTGVIGEAGARDMQAFIAYADQLPTKESIKANPKTAPLPTMPGACAVTVFSLISAAEKSNFEEFMEYVERMEMEWQAVFAVNIAKLAGKQSIAFASPRFAKWLAVNQDVL